VAPEADAGAVFVEAVEVDGPLEEIGSAGVEDDHSVPVFFHDPNSFVVPGVPRIESGRCPEDEGDEHTISPPVERGEVLANL